MTPERRTLMAELLAEFVAEVDDRLPEWAGWTHYMTMRDVATLVRQLNDYDADVLAEEATA